MFPTVQTQDAEASMLTKNIQMNTKIIFKLKITKREAPTVQLVEEWLAEHLISYLMALATLKIRRFKNLEILHSAKQTLLFLLVNGGVDLGGNHTLLAAGRETSDLGESESESESESDLKTTNVFLDQWEWKTFENSPKYQFPSRWHS